jgi:guanylate kinase
MTQDHEARICIISGPSGAGKTTIYKRLLAEYPWLRLSVSATTRKMRPHEQDGVDYQFIDAEAFSRLAEEGAFAEHAQVHGERYGTLKREIEEKAGAEGICLLDIDVQGVSQLIRVYPRALKIFIKPPDMETLERRLQKRSTETGEARALRLAAAKRELEAEELFDYAIINDDLETAYAEVRDILLRHKGAL